MKLPFPKRTKQAGMTLIEVLIASLILFMAIGLSASVFRQSALLQRKVLRQIEQHETKELIKPLIKFELGQDVFSGALTVKGQEFIWDAVLQQDKGFAGDYSWETSSPISSIGKVRVYRITVTSSTEWSFSFRELIWHG